VLKTAVLVNTYNHAPFIQACLDSLWAQTQAPDEVIVYDDGSTDGTVEYLRGLGTRIVFLEGRHENRPGYINQAHAIHSAFLRSQAKLIFLLDGDDRFKPAKIARYVAAFESRSGVAMVQAPLSVINQFDQILEAGAEAHRHRDDYLAAIYSSHDLDLFYSTSALAFSRNFLAQVLPLNYPPDITMWADGYLSILAPLHGAVITLPEPLADWRRHPNAYTVQADKSRFLLDFTLQSTRIFNAYCRQHARPTISLWRNRRFYLRWLRCHLPAWAYNFYHQLLRT